MKNTIATVLLWCWATVLASAQCPPQFDNSAAFDPIPTLLGGGEVPPVTPPPTAPPPSGDLRGIYWVHGFGGDMNSLAQVKTATDEGAGADYKARKTAGVLMTYTTAGLAAAGSDLNDKILMADGTLTARGVTDFSRNFIIAHSQGGVVSRWADKELGNDPPTARRFYGIATFGSPHAGARVVNSRNAGYVSEMAEDACNSVLQTWALEKLEERPILSFLVDPSDVANFIGDMCGNSGSLLPFALTGLFTNVSNGYAVGSAPLNELNAYSSNIHKAGFYGVEYAKPSEDPTDNGFTSKQLLWRTLGTPPDLVSNSPVFSANEDQHLVDAANELMAEYQASYETYKARVEYLESWGLPCPDWMFFMPSGPPPQCYWQSGYFNAVDRRDIYHNAWQWSLGVDRQWKIIIGALAYEATGPGQCLCEEPEDGLPYIDYAASGEADCISNPDGCGWTQPFGVVVRESDGVVTAESAQAFPGAGASMRLDNANHFQLRNSMQTKQALNRLFGFGSWGGDSWFKTDTKQ
jgi:hypothetical protein